MATTNGLNGCFKFIYLQHLHTIVAFWKEEHSESPMTRMDLIFLDIHEKQTS